MMPSVVVHARSGQQDLTEAQVLADGALVAERLDGMPVPLDPGQHTLVVRWQGKTAERQVLLSAGEKARAVQVVWGTEVPQQPPGPEPGQGPRSVRCHGRSTRRWRVPRRLRDVRLCSPANAQGRLDDLDRAGCKPFCDPSDVEKTDRAAVVADVALVVGVATAALAGVLFVTRPTVSHASAR
ncbi:MAG: hypothetical protein IPG50_22965 [Myxococcales bacterium]|nr:hypothetical protein [Myxococcales bacterium]